MSDRCRHQRLTRRYDLVDGVATETVVCLDCGGESRGTHRGGREAHDD